MKARVACDIYEMKARVAYDPYKDAIGFSRRSPLHMGSE
jgi:hypothetical protein